MPILIIDFGPKFSQMQLNDYLFLKKEGNSETPNSNIFLDSFEANYDHIIFDLSLIEWISSEEICFLFGWIRNIKFLPNRKVTIRLPYRDDIRNNPHFNLKILGEKFKEKNGTKFKESDLRIQRRRKRSALLLTIWGMYSNLGLSENDFENMADYGVYNKESRELKENNYQIIGFTPMNLDFDKTGIKLDSHFQEFINNNLDSSFKTQKIFALQKEIKELLILYACYSPFESKILSNVITQELYINSLQHSFENDLRDIIHECYVTAFLSNKWENEKSKYFNISFKDEKYKEIQDFYRDKGKIASEINQTLSNPKYKDVQPRQANLDSFEIYKNCSYLEFTFIDFGNGIYSTLGDEFNKSLNGKTKKKKLSGGFSNKDRHSQILEFAFLLDTSKNPLDNTIQHYQLVPRGLYFLIDMVRRYKGLLICKSGNGNIIFDFSDKIFIENIDGNSKAVVKSTYKITDSIKHIKEEIYFPGTLFSIVFPEKTKTISNDASNVLPAIRNDSQSLIDYAISLSEGEFTLPSHPKEIFYTQDFEYVSILLLYNNVIDECKQKGDEFEIVAVYNSLFSKINDCLDEFDGKNCIIFFDFAGLRTGNSSWIKILYYLINTPKINEQTKGIIVNLPFDEGQFIKNLKNNLAGEDSESNFHDPFLYRPIPCINFKIDSLTEEELISWIGLKDINDEHLFTSLLLGKKESYNLKLHNLTNKGEGNFFVKDDNWIYTTYSGLNDLKEHFFKKQRKAISDFLKSLIESGIDENNVLKHVYIASNGCYQYKYLSLYEILHDKYIARFFAKCLLDNYCLKIESLIIKGENLEQFKFNKIIAVTVSSQLVGVAIRDLIEQDDAYTFLRRDNKSSGRPDSAPELVLLSSYYSFDTEKPFERIEKNDRILLVNDVISTGSLVTKLLDKIENNKKAIINAVFSVADLRLPIERITEKDEIKSIFTQYEDFFFTLSDFRDGIEIKKFNGPYTGQGERKRINPLLNTIVELKAIHSEQNKILFPNASELINDEKLATQYFRIGHFQQNLTHNAYLTDMRPLFSSEAGLYIIARLKDVIEKNNLMNLSANEVNIQLINISNELEKLKSFNSGQLDNGALNELGVKLDDLIIQTSNNRIVNQKYCPDFIFYPIFSGIEKISHLLLSNLFETHPDNIIGLQRFDTPKGWRFPFPAKRFNRLTRNKHILILDSGSLTGESLVQLIDNVSFLDVREITVLSIITRVEDFYREFYSRLRTIKVKRLKEKTETNSSVENNLNIEHIVPIQVLFGINLHIPVYPSSVMCPFCSELEEIEQTSDNSHLSELTYPVTEYLQLRKSELKILNSSREKLSNISYLPKSRKTDEIDTKGIFNTRDLIGKIDSYRFYPEYFEFFNNLFDQIVVDSNWHLNDGIKKEIERILTCLLHEPSLYDLINNYMNGLIPYLSEYLNRKLFSSVSPDLDTFYYRWDLYPLIRLCFILFENELLQIEKFEKMLSWQNYNCKLLFHYKLWDILYNRNSPDEKRTKVESLLRQYSNKYSEQANVNKDIYNPPNREFIRLLAVPYRFGQIGISTYLWVPFYNLNKFVLQGESQGRHFYLKSKLNDVIDSIVSTNPSIDNIRQHLYDVVYIFDEELKPNIKKILSDPQIREACKMLFSFLSADSPGILFYIDNIRTHHQNILKVQQKDISDVKQILSDILALCKTMVNQTLMYLEDKECFYKICKQYPVELVPFFDNLKSQENEVFDISISAGDVASGNHEIAMHKYVMNAIFDEIIKNAKEKSPIEKLLLEIHYNTKNVESQNLLVNIKQNFPFCKNKHKTKSGGLKNIIQHFVEAFGGEFTDNRITSVENNLNYEMTLTFKKHIYDK